MIHKICQTCHPGNKYINGLSTLLFELGACSMLALILIWVQNIVKTIFGQVIFLIKNVFMSKK